jgi:hypothetical protein
MAGWAPALTLVLVPVSVIAAFRGRWAGALSALAIVPVTAAEPWARGVAALAVITAVAVAARPPRDRPGADDGVTFPMERWLAAAVAVSVAGVVAVVLPDEVVLATVLAAGVAIAAARPRPDALPAPDRP